MKILISVDLEGVAGDQPCLDQLAPYLPGARTVVTKESITRFAAHSLHPAESCRRLGAAARDAVRSLGSMPSPLFTLPVSLELDLASVDLAEVTTWRKGVERAGIRSVVIEGEDPVAAYRPFVAASYITRQAGSR